MIKKSQISNLKSQKEVSEKDSDKEKISSVKSVKPAKKSSQSVENQSSKVKPQTEPQTMEELLAAAGSAPKILKKGDTVEGTVISASAKEVLVDIGWKSFGVVAFWELEQVKEYAASFKPGDKVVAQVVNPENDSGYVVLSLRRANMERRWLLLQQTKESGDDIEVAGLETARGGLLVDWQGLRGFVPTTQLEGSFAGNLSTLIGRKIKVKVLEVDKTINRLVLSQKAAALGVTPTAQKEKLAKIKPSDVLKGTVVGIAPFGVFVDVDGLEGLVHISEIAWEKVENPATLFKVGEKIEVLVLEVNKEEGKLNLSIKRLTPDPWKNILDRYPIESTVKGKVVRIAPYGFFIQLDPGIQGLLHISKVVSGEEPKVGESLECMLENIDPVKRKISLTLVPKEKPVGYR